MFKTPSSHCLSLSLFAFLFLGGGLFADDKTPPAATKDADKLQALLKERRDQLQSVLDIQMKYVKGGFRTVDAKLVGTSRALLAAELELTDKRKEQIALHEKHVEFARDVERVTKSRSDTGRGDPVSYHQTRAFRCEAELGLLREQAGAKPSAKQAEETKKLLDERREALHEALKIMDGGIKAGRQIPDGNYFELSKQLIRVEEELATDPKERIALHEEVVKRAKDFEKIAKAMVEHHTGDPVVAASARASRCEAEIGLLRLRYGDKPTAEQVADTKKLLDERLDALQEEFDMRWKHVQSGIGIDSMPLDTSRRLLQADLERADKSQQRVSAYERRLENLKECEKIAEARIKGGKDPGELYPQAKAARLEVEIGLLRERIKANAQGK